jgi:hypothetical protein
LRAFRGARTTPPRPRRQAIDLPEIPPHDRASGLGLNGNDASTPARSHQNPPAKRQRPPACSAPSSRRERRRETASRLRNGKERSSYRGELEQRERFAKRIEAEWTDRMDHAQRTTLARELRLLPPYLFRGCWTIVADSSGDAARVAWMGKPAVWRAKMLRAALAIMNGRARYKFNGQGPSALRARRICALAWALSELTWKGQTSKKWSGGYVAGVTQGALRQLLRDTTETDEKLAVPSRSALIGFHRADGSIANGQCGYLQALREVDFAYWQRVPSGIALPCERWGQIFKSGRSVDLISSRYWLCSRTVERTAAADPWIHALLECTVNWVRHGLGKALALLALPPPTSPPLAA